jgi:uncharacterized protein with FMN-binding domain
MKRRRAHRIVPAALMAGVAAVPAFTMAEMLTHVSGAGASSLTSSQPVAAAPTAPPTAVAAPTPQPEKTVAARPTATPSTRTYTGAVVDDRYGGVQATITVQGKRITAVSIAAPMNDPRSASINQQAVPLLQSETLQAQSANINLVSGATETSDAYLQSLQGALDQARI